MLMVIFASGQGSGRVDKQCSEFWWYCGELSWDWMVTWRVCGVNFFGKGTFAACCVFLGSIIP